MNYKFLLIGCLSFLLPFSANAQHRVKRVKRPVVVTAPKENPKFTAMLPSTAKLCIVDSVVVDSLDYLNAIYENHEEGHLTTYRQFFNKEGDGIVYVNQLGNECIYSLFDERVGYKRLFHSDLLDKEWSNGELLKGIDDNEQLRDFDFPYLMPDGVTLYFAARGSESLGGYDIYRTRFDADAGKYLKPENLGLPFNSEQDDFMFVVDEQNKLGYFVSNRRQPQGKTCVYTFVPFESRTLASASEDKIRSLARIDRIADTWSSREEREAAYRRKLEVMEQAKGEQSVTGEPKLNFVVNDNLTYSKMSDFRHAQSRSNMKQVLDLRKQLTEREQALAKLRTKYTRASSLEREDLNNLILQSEEQITMIHKQIRLLEKTIRNTENQK